MTAQQIPGWFQKISISLLATIAGFFLLGVYTRLCENERRVVSLEKNMAVVQEQYSTIIEGQAEMKLDLKALNNRLVERNIP